MAIVNSYVSLPEGKPWTYHATWSGSDILTMLSDEIDTISTLW